MPTPLAVEEFLSIQVRLIVQNKFNGVARMRSHNAERTEEIQPLIHGKVLIGSRSYAPGNLAPVMEQKGINVAAEIGMEPSKNPKTPFAAPEALTVKIFPGATVPHDWY
jgi:hypothetical protein